MKLTTFRLTEEQLEGLKEQARSTGIRVSVLIRSAIADFLVQKARAIPQQTYPVSATRLDAMDGPIPNSNL